MWMFFAVTAWAGSLVINGVTVDPEDDDPNAAVVGSLKRFAAQLRDGEVAIHTVKLDVASRILDPLLLAGVKGLVVVRERHLLTSTA